MAELLALDDVSAGYDAAVVLDGVRASIHEGEAVALLGRNGVGKSTLLAAILGLARHHGGALRWRGADITALPTHARARLGIGWVPQGRRTWRSLSVEEHLASVARPGPWDAARALERFPSLAARRRHRGSELSGGEQQMLAIARALVTNPALLLLDEPTEGLAPRIVEELAAVLQSLAGGAMAVLLVEQHSRLALSLTARAWVMERGRIVHEAPSAALAADRATLERYLGVS